MKKHLGIYIAFLFLLVGMTIFNIRMLDSQNASISNVLKNYAQGTQNEVNELLVFWDTETYIWQRLINRQIQSDSSGIELPLENIEYLFKIKPGLIQYRIINEQGFEIYRADRSIKGITVSDKNGLQDKSSLYYVQRGFDIPPDAMYLSYIDLNIENKNIVYPYQKIIRIVKPFFIKEKKYLFVFNILLNDYLTKSEQLLKTLGQRYAFIDSYGHYLVDSTGQAFKDQLSQDPSTFFDEFPELVGLKNSTESDVSNIRWFIQPLTVGDNLLSLSKNRPINILGEKRFYYVVSKPLNHWSNWPVFEPLPLLVIGLIVLMIVFLYVDLIRRGQEKDKLELRVAEKHNIDALLKKEFEQLKREEENKSRMLSNISHEIRTPLNALVGLMQIIDAKISDEELKSFAKIMLDNADRMSTLFKNMRDISESDAGDFVIENRPFNLFQVLEEPFKKSQKEATVKGLKYDLDTSGVSIDQFFGDGSRIVQIFEELISNAIKFTSSGDVSVVINFVNNQLSISVKDNGVGISSEFEQTLFTPFQQQDMNLTKAYQGIGLGLSVAKKIAIQMGGDLTYQKNYPHGSEFILRVPLKPLLEKQKTNNDYPSIYSGRVLLIEDNMTNAVVIKNMLNKLGFTVDHAEDDQQALSLINTFSYELFVCDFHLGGYNLLDLYERFPEHIKSIPAIVLTGHASPALIKLLKEEGFEYVLYKPANSSELAQVIQRVL